MITYILILVFAHSSGISSQQVEFPSQKSCEAAGNKAVRDLGKYTAAGVVVTSYSCVAQGTK